VICYEALIERIKAIALSGHVNLVETLAERISDGICSEVPAITKIKVKVCKLAAFDNVLSVGVELEKNF
jgi:dihydroneopterin aldolase